MSKKQAVKPIKLSEEKYPKAIKPKGSAKNKPKNPGQPGRPKGAYQYSDQEVIEAVKGSGGLYGAISEKLGCCRGTISVYVKERPIVRDAINEERENTVDQVENSLLTQCTAGSVPAIMYYLNCKGSDRGYCHCSKIDQTTRVEQSTVEVKIFEVPDNGRDD